MAIDKFLNTGKRRTDPPANAEAIVLGVDFTNVCTSIWVGVAGHLNVTLNSGTLIEYKNVPAGRFKVEASRVTTTVGTATELLAEWQ